MARVEYKAIALRGKAMTMVTQAQAIFDDPENAGMTMTLRQLYYQFVQSDLIPNNKLSYRKLARVMSDARIAGLIDWDLIEDRGRRPLIWATHESTEQSVADALASFNLDHWQDQNNHVELWVEKDALSAVLRPLAEEFQAVLMVNKGYSSTSAVREAAERMISIGKPTTILYVGDFDPSGEDMVRDIASRLELFGVPDLEIDKIAITMPQIRQYRPPPNPAKITDPRARDYIRQHGNQSWEVDALRPSVLRLTIQKAFRALMDMPKFEAWTKKTNAQRADAVRRVGEKRSKVTLKIADNYAAIEANEDDLKRLTTLQTQVNETVHKQGDALRAHAKTEHALRAELKAQEKEIRSQATTIASIAKARDAFESDRAQLGKVIADLRLEVLKLETKIKTLTKKGT